MASLFLSTLNTRYLPTGDKKYIRSDCPYLLTPKEIEWLIQNGFKTVVDLRGKDECEARPCILESEKDIKYYHMPVTVKEKNPSSPEIIRKVYLDMLDEQTDEIVDFIINSETNVMFFCGSGQDRTGVVSALILKKLGFDDKTIIDDYMVTKENLLHILQAMAGSNSSFNLDLVLPKEELIKLVL